jgi:hypothetical protein
LATEGFERLSNESPHSERGDDDRYRGSGRGCSIQITRHSLQRG